MLRTLYILCRLAFLIGISGIGKPIYGQVDNPLKALYIKANAYAKEALDRSENLVMLRGDVVSRLYEEGGETKLSLVELQEGYTYTFRIETNEEIRSMLVLVVDIETEDTLQYSLVQDEVLKFTLKGKNNIGLVQLVVGEFGDEQTSTGAYSLVITSVGKPARKTRPSRSTRPSGGTTRTQPADCNMDAIAKRKFKTEFRIVESTRSDSRKRSIFISHIRFRLAQNEILQKPRGGRELRFTVIERACSERAVYTFEVVDELGRFYTMTLDLRPEKEVLIMAPHESSRLEIFPLIDL